LNKTGGILVHRYYSAMTPPPNPRAMEVSIVNATIRRRGKAWDGWVEADIQFQLDGVIKTIYVATEGDWHARDDAPQIVWLHVPDLCAGVKAAKRSLLTFAGRLDERATGSAGELGMNNLYPDSLQMLEARILHLCRVGYYWSSRRMGQELNAGKDCLLWRV